MTEYSRFFDNTAYTEAQFAEVMKSVMTKNGVDLQVTGYLAVTQTSPTPAMFVDVAVGAAWIQGAWYSNTAVKTLTVPTAHGTHPRYDRVVLRLEWAANSIILAYKEGTAGASPVVPALTQSSSIWEIALAYVYVPANCPAIYTAIATNGSYITTELLTATCGVAGANLGLACVDYDGTINMASCTVSHMADPAAAQDAATKAYVDAHCNVSGMIQIWSGSIATIPTGYVVCDGTNSTPNLVGKFVLGTKTDSGATYDVGDTGGAATHAIEVAELPAHTHSIGVGSGAGATGYGAGAFDTGTTGSTGSGTAMSLMPPYYVLAYIMKT